MDIYTGNIAIYIRKPDYLYCFQNPRATIHKWIKVGETYFCFERDCQAWEGIIKSQIGKDL